MPNGWADRASRSASQNYNEWRCRRTLRAEGVEVLASNGEFIQRRRVPGPHDEAGGKCGSRSPELQPRILMLSTRAPGRQLSGLRHLSRRLHSPSMSRSACNQSSTAPVCSPPKRTTPSAEARLGGSERMQARHRVRGGEPSFRDVSDGSGGDGFGSRYYIEVHCADPLTPVSRFNTITVKMVVRPRPWRGPTRVEALCTGALTGHEA